MFSYKIIIKCFNFLKYYLQYIKGGSHNQPFQPGQRSNHQGHTVGEEAVKNYLRTKGCKCHDTTYLNITSTDSRYEYFRPTIYSKNISVLVLLYWLFTLHFKISIFLIKIQIAQQRSTWIVQNGKHVFSPFWQTILGQTTTSS